MDTAWNFPGQSGEWIMISSDTEQYVSGIRILNGYTKHSDAYEYWIYYMNHRPKDITIMFSDSTFIDVTLEDVFDEDNYIYQHIPLEVPKLTTYIKIIINSSYLGTRWDDCCITEVEVY